MKKIQIVEDDMALREELTTLLRSNGYEVVYSGACDLALMDVGLPGESGYERCRKLRTVSSVPVIFLTGRCAPEDELMGFAMGADDYIVKPYNSAVLLARIARLLKSENVTEARGLRLQDMKAAYGGRTVELTRNESRILEIILRKGSVSRADVIGALWDDGAYVDENTLNVNVNRLRKKLDEIGAVGFIKTIRGFGYSL